MMKKSVVHIALALALATSSNAFAQGNSQHQRYNNNGNSDCRDGNCVGPDQRPHPRPNVQQPHRPDFQQRQEQDRNQQRYAPPRGYDNARHDNRGAGPDHSFYRGDRLPPRYRERQYVVEDWHGHHLSAPPRGYHWVQNGGDYLLVAIATGVILQLLLTN